MSTHFRKPVCIFIMIVVLLALLTIACSTTGGDEATQAPTKTPEKSGDDKPQQPGGEIPQPGSGETPQPSNDGSQLSIRVGAARVDETGYLNIPGSIENHTGQWIANVIVNIKLFNKDGKELATTSTLGEADQRAVAINGIIPPDGIAYFHYLRDTSSIEGEYDHYQLSVEAYDANSHAILDISDLDIGSLSDEVISVNGKITNNSSDDCNFPAAVVVGFSGGLVYSAEPVYPKDSPDVLAPGGSMTFQALVMNAEKKIDEIKVIGGCAGW